MNKVKYLIGQELLQDVLNYIAISNSTAPAGKVVQLVDKLRNLDIAGVEKSVEVKTTEVKVEN